MSPSTRIRLIRIATPTLALGALVWTMTGGAGLIGGVIRIGLWCLVIVGVLHILGDLSAARARRGARPEQPR